MDYYQNRARVLQNKIKMVLLNEWDPIGVRDIPEANDEYDAYVANIYKMLISHKSIHEICDYLWEVETKYMGLIGSKKNTINIAKRLLDVYESVEEV